jgi:hypothetical protein
MVTTRGVWFGLFASAALMACTSGRGGPPPFTAAETERALRPIKQLEPRCYADSQSKHEKRGVRLEFVLYVDERGSVRSDPVLVDPRDAALTECLRAGLDALHFPAKGESDQIRISFDLNPRNQDDAS